MSGILIKGMKMPKENEKVVLILQSNGEVTICGERLLSMAFSSPAANPHGLVVKKTKAIEAWNTRPDPWHTGVPTEDGDYLVKLDVEHNVYPYYVLKWNKKGWYSHYDMDYPACPQHSVLKWQKIEEASNGDGN